MSILYYKHISLPEDITVPHDNSMRDTGINIFKTLVKDHLSYGLIKSRIVFVYIGKENGLFYSKICIRNVKYGFTYDINECSTYFEDYLISHIKSYIDQIRNGILFFITDKDRKEEFNGLIRFIGKELKIKRKPEIIL